MDLWSFVSGIRDVFQAPFGNVAQKDTELCHWMLKFHVCNDKFASQSSLISKTENIDLQKLRMQNFISSHCKTKHTFIDT